MLRWQHVMIGTHCSWLPGSRRGFRSRDHRIHSSGDYKNPPPEHEHEGLRRYHERFSGEPVDFDINVRVIVCREFVLKLKSLGYRVIACSVGRRHLHALVELDADYHLRRKQIGKCKQKASHAVRSIIPGTIWAEGGEFKPVRDASHLHNVFNYIRTQQEPGAVVWSHKPDEDWIADESVDVIVVGPDETHIRLTQTPDAGV
jgi:hypothetical protein